MNNKILIVIPSRYNSTRFIGKPLKKIGNKTLIERVWDKAKQIKSYKTVVATDDKRIAIECKKKHIKYVMTSKKHKTGSDRVSEVAKKFNISWILNIQGDEPLINVKDINTLIKKTFQHYKKDKTFVASTLYLKKKFKVYNPNECNLMINKKNEVLYFTRQNLFINKDKEYLKHIGIYLYQRNFLKNFSSLSSSLEDTEKLEQLRIIDNGYKMIAFKARSETIGVDTAKDLIKVTRVINLQK